MATSMQRVFALVFDNNERHTGKKSMIQKKAVPSISWMLSRINTLGDEISC